MLISQDYEEFLRELEEDPDMRQQIQLFKAGGQVPHPTAATSAMADDEMDDDEADFPDVNVDELLDDMTGLSLNDQ